MASDFSFKTQSNISMRRFALAPLQDRRIVARVSGSFANWWYACETDSRSVGLMPSERSAMASGTMYVLEKRFF